MAWTDYGVLNARKGRDAQALKAWKQALEVRPNLAGARLNRARYWFRRGDCRRMESDLLRMRPEGPSEKRDRVWLRKNCSDRDFTR